MINRNARGVIKPECFEVYKKWREDIWQRILETRTILIMLECVENYIKRLSPDFIESSPFWIFVKYIFNHKAILLIHCLVNDEKYSYTLNRFRNEIYKDWLREREVQREFSKELKQVEFRKLYKEDLRRIKTERDYFIAHSPIDLETGLPRLAEDWTSTPELLKICNAIEKYFKVCCFGDHLSMTLIRYNKGLYDIDDIFRLLVCDSSSFKAPETLGEVAWKEIKKHKSAEYLQKLNELRKKYGYSGV